MANERVTLKDIYEINEKIYEKMDKLDARTSDLEIWRAELKGKIAIVVVVFSIGFTLLVDYVKSQFNK